MIDWLVNVLTQLWVAWPTWVPIVAAMVIISPCSRRQLTDLHIEFIHTMNKSTVALSELIIAKNLTIKSLQEEVESIKAKIDAVPTPTPGQSNLAHDEETARVYEQHFGNPPSNF